MPFNNSRSLFCLVLLFVIYADYGEEVKQFSLEDFSLIDSYTAIDTVRILSQNPQTAVDQVFVDESYIAAQSPLSQETPRSSTLLLVGVNAVTVSSSTQKITLNYCQIVPLYHPLPNFPVHESNQISISSLCIQTVVLLA